MIKVTDITKSYGSRVLFKDLSFSINQGEKIGLVGRNGYGKTTLFRLLLGQIEPDSGSVAFPRNYRIGCLEQHIAFSRDTVLKEGCLSLSGAEKDDHWRVEKVLSGLGFTKTDLQRSPAHFSGGYQIRLNLAKVLVAKPDLLLLDEPNNYLDIVAIRWLSEFLRSWQRELMLITHDRSFMDSVTTHTMIIHRQKVRKMEGGTEKLYGQIARDEEIYEKTRVNEEKKKKKTELFIRRFRAKARLGGLVQSRIKCLEKQETKDELEKLQALDFSFNAAPFPAARMMAVHSVSFSYGAGHPVLIDNLSLNVGKRERICIIGKNGKGKSTLLRMLAGELSAVSGSFHSHPAVKMGYFGQSNVARLRDDKTVFEEIISGDPECPPQRARTICGTMMFGGDAGLKKIAVLSGGEKSRVLLGKLLVAPCNLLLLDEPTNHLDLESCEAVVEALDAFAGSVIMVTHNELYLHRLAERLIVFDGGVVRVFDGTYGEFLERVGWQDEQDDPAQPAGAGAAQSDRKARKKLKAELLQEKARALKPFEAETAELERTIGLKETEQHRTTELLVKASMECDAGAIAELSKKNHALRGQIDGLYGKLDAVLRVYEEKSRIWKEKMESLEEA